MNRLTVDKSLMVSSNLFQLFIQNGKKMLSHLSVLENGGLITFLRIETLFTLYTGIWSSM